MTLKTLIQKFTETERQERLILHRLKIIGIQTIEQFRWITTEELKESRAFGPLYLRKLNMALIELRGE